MFRLTLAAVAVALALAPSGADDAKPVQLFNGKDLSGWKIKDEKKNKWQACAISVNEKKPNEFIGGIDNSPDKGNTVLANVTSGGTDIYTEEKYGDVHVEVEFMIPKGSNSVYLMGEYEVQILDSFGRPDDKLTQGDLGALYSAARPPKNAAKKPGEWQKFVIDFQAPKFEGEKKTANAKFTKVVFNDVLIHENVEVTKSTGGGLTGKEHATGPLMFQGDHGPVAFRNIKITPMKKQFPLRKEGWEQGEPLSPLALYFPVHQNGGLRPRSPEIKGDTPPARLLIIPVSIPPPLPTETANDDRSRLHTRVGRRAGREIRGQLSACQKSGTGVPRNSRRSTGEGKQL